MNTRICRLLCAWCGKLTGAYIGHGDSHGICQACLAHVLKENV